MPKCWLALCLGFTSLVPLLAQGTKTKDDVSSYDAKTHLGPVALGADFLGHYIPLEHSTLKTDVYLVVDVALYAPPNSKLDVSSGQFTLRVNGERLLAQSPGQVTLANSVPDMRERGPHLETLSGVGPVIYQTGNEPPRPQFPGDPDSDHYPDAGHDSGNMDANTIDPVKVVRDTALPEGSHATPISGCLYYYFRGSAKKAKHIVLEYSGPLGATSLTLR